MCLLTTSYGRGVIVPGLHWASSGFCEVLVFAVNEGSCRPLEAPPGGQSAGPGLVAKDGGRLRRLRAAG